MVNSYRLLISQYYIFLLIVYGFLFLILVENYEDIDLVWSCRYVFGLE